MLYDNRLIEITERQRLIFHRETRGISREYFRSTSRETHSLIRGRGRNLFRVNHLFDPFKISINPNHSQLM